MIRLTPGQRSGREWRAVRPTRANSFPALIGISFPKTKHQASLTVLRQIAANFWTSKLRPRIELFVVGPTLRGWVFVQWKCCVRNTLILCWTSHRSSVLSWTSTTEGPQVGQRCIQWAPNTLLNIILLFVKNGSWFLLMVRLVESNRGHESPQALICLYPHLKTGEVHFICHFFGRRSFLVKLNHSNLEKWIATICINRYHQIDVVVCF